MGRLIEKSINWRNKMGLYKKNSEGSNKIILVITAILFILFSCCALEAQINREVFIQFGLHRYTINFNHCLVLFLVYNIGFIPITMYWITGGFREDESNKFM
jgi:hypothetical protein